jgi:hypothetical protein
LNRSDGVQNFTPPVRAIVDASADGVFFTYVAIIRAPQEKPRLIYKVITHGDANIVEAWAINDLVRRINR